MAVALLGLLRDLCAVRFPLPQNPRQVPRDVLLVGQQLPVAVLAGLGFGAGRAATPVLRRLSGAAEVWDDDLRKRLPVLKAGAAAVLLAALALILVGPVR